MGGSGDISQHRKGSGIAGNGFNRPEEPDHYHTGLIPCKLDSRGEFEGDN